MTKEVSSDTLIYKKQCRILNMKHETTGTLKIQFCFQSPVTSTSITVYQRLKATVTNPKGRMEK